MLANTNAIAVGLGELKVSRQPLDVLVAYGLGSCVGVAMYDAQARVGGLLHAVLPERLQADEGHHPKYVPSGIQALLAEMERAGAVRARVNTWLVGGANMLNAPGFKQGLNIGERNVAAAHACLARHGLRIRAQETGGQVGRTLRLYVAGGRLTIRSMGNPEHELT